MTPRDFSSTSEIIEHCRAQGSRLRDVVTDMHRDPPRIYMICSSRTFMVRPTDVVELQRQGILPPEITDYFVEHQILPAFYRASN